jgi:hypothetical protein
MPVSEMVQHRAGIIDPGYSWRASAFCSRQVRAIFHKPTL